MIWRVDRSWSVVYWRWLRIGRLEVEARKIDFDYGCKILTNRQRVTLRLNRPSCLRFTVVVILGAAFLRVDFTPFHSAPKRIQTHPSLFTNAFPHVTLFRRSSDVLFTIAYNSYSLRCHAFISDAISTYGVAQNENIPSHHTAIPPCYSSRWFILFH
ncbi:hypothetical protein CPB83DRAFT_268473 [Crepidotus variabilis]|uniref:Uncharacterized protein n=1 Tax=Crepidotus variabilis TaxID=179855 RepID=A0A9P6JRF2_9AGAR|nr:hypothetical protein CPB83DRAFT_268473 [Crepidotus variabilis]